MKNYILLGISSGIAAYKGAAANDLGGFGIDNNELMVITPDKVV